MADVLDTPNELIPLSYSLVNGDDGKYATVLMLGDHPCMTVGDAETPEEAVERLKDLTAKALTRMITWTAIAEQQANGEISVETETSTVDGYVWRAHWASDLQESQLARLCSDTAGVVVIDRIDKPDVSVVGYAPEYPVYLIYRHFDQDCPGHHFAGSGRTPVWIGTPVPPLNIEEP